MLFVILATGQSLTQDAVDYVKGKATVIAVSDAYKLAPWADALVSHDTAWWRNNPEAMNFANAKYSYHDFPGTKRIRPVGAPVACNSGLLAMLLARDYGATQIVLLGFDMHGTHFFGKHPEPLKNTNERRFEVHRSQFDAWSWVPVINCTPGSALKKFPFANLQDVV